MRTAASRVVEVTDLLERGPQQWNSGTPPCDPPLNLPKGTNQGTFKVPILYTRVLRQALRTQTGCL